ncbi:MAG: ATP-binding cassette domain-containing protein [Coriobacteriia bacterium]|nr:ATP-binding cassette domain-containing protein [Coriobacteriia bacterium]MBS5478495.1 ATP-binding cassette domain-containing protein [Coriobacteriia bacterium]
MLQLSGVTKRFGDRTVLDDLCLSVEDGAFLTITGPSGAGKTTLLNVMGGLERPDAGTVLVDGVPLRPGRPALLFHRRQAGFLFQDFALMEDETVRSNLDVALAYRSDVRGRSERLATMRAALAQVGLDADVTLPKRVYQLSGGEQQRVALARLVCKDPSYVFADEPTGNLDAANRDVVLGVLSELNEAGKTVVVVTHDPVVADAACVTQRVCL